MSAEKYKNSTASQMCILIAHGKPRMKISKPNQIGRIISFVQTKNELQQIRMEIHSLGMHAFFPLLLSSQCAQFIKWILAFAILSTSIEWRNAKNLAQNRTIINCYIEIEFI